MSKGRGRPAGSGTTRSRPALLFAVWRLVQEEISLRQAPSVVAACAAIIDRWPTLTFIYSDGTTIGRVSTASTLRQWFAAAERACSVDEAFQAQCSAWRERMDAQWPDLMARTAAEAAMGSVERRIGSVWNEQDLATLVEAAEVASSAGRAAAGPRPAPKKHRR